MARLEHRPPAPLRVGEVEAQPRVQLRRDRRAVRARVEEQRDLDRRHQLQHHRAAAAAHRRGGRGRRRKRRRRRRRRERDAVDALARAAAAEVAAAAVRRRLPARLVLDLDQVVQRERVGRCVRRSVARGVARRRWRLLVARRVVVGGQLLVDGGGAASAGRHRRLVGHLGALLARREEQPNVGDVEGAARVPAAEAEHHAGDARLERLVAAAHERGTEPEAIGRPVRARAQLEELGRLALLRREPPRRLAGRRVRWLDPAPSARLDLALKVEVAARAEPRAEPADRRALRPGFRDQPQGQHGAADGVVGRRDVGVPQLGDDPEDLAQIDRLEDGLLIPHRVERAELRVGAPLLLSHPDEAVGIAVAAAVGRKQVLALQDAKREGGALALVAHVGGGSLREARDHGGTRSVVRAARKAGMAPLRQPSPRRSRAAFGGSTSVSASGQRHRKEVRGLVSKRHRADLRPAGAG